MKIAINELLESAELARENSYSPYSKFRVGAALLGDDGKIYTGTNIENASYGATLCAERSAISRAVSEGVTRIVAIAVVSDSDKPTTPCGICRQVIAEFADKGTIVVCGGVGARVSDGGLLETGNKKENVAIYNLATLLPDAFNLKQS